MRGVLILVALSLGLPAAAPVSAAERGSNSVAAVAVSREASAAGIPGEELTYWGWVVVRKPSESYVPASADAGNSTGGNVSVSRFTPGSYEIRFNGLTASSYPEGGVTHVSPIATKARSCRVDYTTATGSIDLLIAVKCFRRNGDPADTRFALSYLATTDEQGTLGYLRTINGDNPLIWDEYYTFNSADQQVTATRSATGTYSVLFTGLNTAGGSVLVTSFTPNGLCRAGAWNTVAQGVQVGVRCYNTAGSLSDGPFMVSFMDGLGVKGFGGGSEAAYLLADQPKIASYTPPAAFRFSTEGGTPKVKHLGKGQYRVVVPNLGVGGAALVTATGAGNQTCQLGALPATGSPRKIEVRCFTPDGQPANSQFTLSFVK
jgi:hypothetical protein